MVKITHWLSYMGIEFYVIWPTSVVRLIKLEFLSTGEVTLRLSIDNKILDLDESVSCMIESAIIKNEFISKIEIQDDIDKSILQFFISEWNTLTDYLIYKIERQKCLGSKMFGAPNKLIQLELAAKEGLIVPKTEISKAFKSLNNQNIANLITKPFREVYKHTSNGAHYQSFTGNVNVEEFKLDQDSFPFLIQDYIKKKFELRIFYLKGKFYSCAIFSQQDENSKIDFRINAQSLRMVPFQLPYVIELKIKNLMDKLMLDTGSIDMIYSNTGEYIFLEVNPVGIFDNISYLTNGFFHKKIAHLLAYES